jgi:hypothetical protein
MQMAKPHQPLVDFTEIPYDSDDWELFTRDLLQTMGLYIETPPSRGSDLGKDLLVTETLEGNVSNLKVRWLVSCKHFATSGKSVNENDDERNILERVQGFNADGFIGVYSTIASAGLIGRLEQLRTQQRIKDFRVLDRREIENRLVVVGYSTLLMRYFPQSYKRLKPIHTLDGQYVPLLCAHCGKDVLKQLFVENHSANIVMIRRDDNGCDVVERVFCACKGDCDKILSTPHKLNGTFDGWMDIGDLAVPFQYLHKIFAVMNNLRDGSIRFEEQAYHDLKQVFIALSQKVLREMTEEEWDRWKVLRDLPI